MKRIAVILTFPYLVPVAIALCVEQLWASIFQRNAAIATVSGGEVPAWYLFMPLALVVQILAGIPGSLFISKATSRRSAVVSAVFLASLPIVFLSTSGGSGAMERLLPLLGIVGLFVIGSSVSLYCLHFQKA